MARLPIATVLVAFAWLSHAQTTTIDVPQGSGQFPTIGQVNCLADEGSGRYCAATYECDGGSGELWGDMANHNGRRAISATSPVANGRGCEITVDGKAAVQWFTGYRPAGRTGELVGLTTSADALRPVVRGGGSTGGANADGYADGLLIDWLIAEHGLTVEGWQERSCSHFAEGHPRRDECMAALSMGNVNWMALTPYTQCLSEMWMIAADDNPDAWEVDDLRPVEFVIKRMARSGANIVGCRLRDGEMQTGLGLGAAEDKGLQCCSLYADQLRGYGLIGDEHEGHLP